MKTLEEKIANRVLPPFNEVCGRGKCKHKKCECGHCQLNYHIGKTGECTKIMDIHLTPCPCKKFKI